MTLSQARPSTGNCLLGASPALGTVLSVSLAGGTVACWLLAAAAWDHKSESARRTRTRTVTRTSANTSD